MKKQNILIVVIIAILIIAGLLYMFIRPAPMTASNDETTVLAENLDVPWAMDFLPNGTMIFTERRGIVSLLEEDGTTAVVADINVSQESESGLLGVAVDPNFNENKYIYLYYTREDGQNRISQFILDGTLTGENVLLDNIPGSPIHNGGRLKFGPDGKLYATTGDAGVENIAQDVNSLGGKILRLNPDGTVPSDNPFGNYVYTYGHRNPQGITWNHDNGILYASEHGSTMNDEINIITSGGNYGWPDVQGDENRSGYMSPLRVYTNFTLAPSGIVFYQNRLYVTGLRGSQLRVLTLSSNGESITDESILLNDRGRIRDVVVHEGFLYISTSNQGDDKIIKIKL